ncbi:hypothetical protein AB0L99_24535 [Streptomyces sp. NPDC051954]
MISAHDDQPVARLGKPVQEPAEPAIGYDRAAACDAVLSWLAHT